MLGDDSGENLHVRDRGALGHIDTARRPVPGGRLDEPNHSSGREQLADRALLGVIQSTRFDDHLPYDLRELAREPRDLGDLAGHHCEGILIRVARHQPMVEHPVDLRGAARDRGASLRYLALMSIGALVKRDDGAHLHAASGEERLGDDDPVRPHAHGREIQFLGRLTEFIDAIRRDGRVELHEVDHGAERRHREGLGRGHFFTRG